MAKKFPIRSVRAWFLYRLSMTKLPEWYVEKMTHESILMRIAQILTRQETFNEITRDQFNDVWESVGELEESAVTLPIEISDVTDLEDAVAKVDELELDLQDKASLEKLYSTNVVDSIASSYNLTDSEVKPMVEGYLTSVATSNLILTAMIYEIGEHRDFKGVQWNLVSLGSLTGKLGIYRLDPNQINSGTKVIESPIITVPAASGFAPYEFQLPEPGLYAVVFYTGSTYYTTGAQLTSRRLPTPAFTSDAVKKTSDKWRLTLFHTSLSNPFPDTYVFGVATGTGDSSTFSLVRA